jgi:hypothetical protein
VNVIRIAHEHFSRQSLFLRTCAFTEEIIHVFMNGRERPVTIHWSTFTDTNEHTRVRQENKSNVVDYSFKHVFHCFLTHAQLCTRLSIVTTEEKRARKKKRKDVEVEEEKQRVD